MSLPDLLPNYVRLYRIDNTPRSLYRPVSGLSGRWFSDDAGYIDRHYGGEGRQWTYVDMPREVAELCRYERVRHEEPNLYGVETKDYVLPLEWAAKRMPCERPIDQITEDNTGDLDPLPITELTSNVAIPGRILDYDRNTGRTVVVEKIEGNTALILTKNRKYPREAYIRQVVPVRRVKRLDKST